MSDPMKKITSRDPFEVPGQGITVTATPSDWQLMQLFRSAGSYEGVTLTEKQEKALLKFYGFDRDFDKKRAGDLQTEVQARYENQLKAWGDAERTGDWDSYKNQFDIKTYGRPSKPTQPNNASILPLLEAGATRNMNRAWKREGLRVMAFLSTYLEQGEDPVKLVARLCVEAGYDVPNDVDWIYGELDQED